MEEGPCMATLPLGLSTNLKVLIWQKSRWQGSGKIYIYLLITYLHLEGNESTAQLNLLNLFGKWKMKDDQLCSPKDYDKRRLCINNWFCTQKTKIGIRQTTWIQRVVEALPVPAPLLPFSPRAWENCQQFAYHFQSEYFRGEIEHPAFHNPKSGFLGKKINTKL